MNSAKPVLITAQSPEELGGVRAVFCEYAQTLGIDLTFQGFDEELSSLPGDYAPPRGTLLLALIDADDMAPTEDEDILLQRPSDPRMRIAGCCALRPLDAADYPNAAEMKRLYVRPSFRGLGLGRQLAEAILDAGRSAGYSCVLLDTLSDMESARALYEDLGFTEVPPYYHNPIAGSHYLKVDL